MREYARQRKLRRWFLAVPFLSPGLSSRWLTLVTPVYASIGRFLIESVRTPSVVRRPEAARIFKVRPAGLARAVKRALTNEDLLLGRNPLVGRRVSRGVGQGGRAGADCSEQRTRNKSASFSRRGVRTSAPHRRSNRLVFRQLVVENSRIARFDDGRRGDAARAARPGNSATGQHAGFLASADLRGRPPFAATGGDASPRAGVAGVPCRCGRASSPSSGRSPISSRTDLEACCIGISSGPFMR